MPDPNSTSFPARCLQLLLPWSRAAERHWYPSPADPNLGCYRSGYNSWGVQTNQKYISAMAVLAAHGPATHRSHSLARALAALRFMLATHLTGEHRCTDGTQWGHTWISALGIERMMHAIPLLNDAMTVPDHVSLRRVLTSESDWLLHHYTKGGHTGIVADPWNHTGKNVPESNLWNGALLWRTAVMYPDHPHVADWQERAHRFLINAVSIAADATDDHIIADQPIRARHAGANFFPHYGLDHHGYLNLGYMVICTSNAAMLHFDLKALNLPRPQSLDHHQADLWAVLRRMIFADGRLARLGGDTRIRYAYCQDYLLPALMYAADHLNDLHALALADAQLNLIEQETRTNPDGSFYASRLAELSEANPYYYTRLESDRAAALAMALIYRRLVQSPPGPAPSHSFESSVTGGWSEPDHGDVLHRCPTRLASFSWRADHLMQGLCLPPDDGHLAEWQHNLAGIVRFIHHPNAKSARYRPHRKLRDHRIDSFDGGFFLTSGAVFEGVDLELAEGWTGTDSALHQLVFAALPDGHTVVALQHCRTAPRRTYIAEVKCLHFNLPNDLFNNFQRRLTTATGPLSLHSPATSDQILPLASTWANVEDRLGIIGLYGADNLSIHRSPRSPRRRLPLPPHRRDLLPLSHRRAARRSRPSHPRHRLDGHRQRRHAHHPAPRPHQRLPLPRHRHPRSPLRRNHRHGRPPLPPLGQLLFPTSRRTPRPPRGRHLPRRGHRLAGIDGWFHPQAR